MKKSPSKKKTLIVEREQYVATDRIIPMRSSPKRKSPRHSPEKGRMSPVRRIIDMKNAYIKNQKKAYKNPENHGKMIYTISPEEGYIVNQEFFDAMDSDEIVKKSEEL